MLIPRNAPHKQTFTEKEEIHSYLSHSRALLLRDVGNIRNGYYALYGLYYGICRHYLSENKLAYVSNGCKSMTERSNVHDFLIARFGFRKVYADMRVTYKWWFGCLVRALYPFRHVFSNSKLKAVMRQEEINRIMKSVSPTAC